MAKDFSGFRIDQVYPCASGAGHRLIDVIASIFGIVGDPTLHAHPGIRTAVEKRCHGNVAVNELPERLWRSIPKQLQRGSQASAEPETRMVHETGSLTRLPALDCSGELLAIPGERV